jgi:adenylate cyclase
VIAVAFTAMDGAPDDHSVHPLHDGRDDARGADLGSDQDYEVPGRDLRDRLIEYGGEPDEVERALRAGRTGALASDLVLRQGSTLSARDLAERAGLGVDRVLSMYRDVGVVVTDVDGLLFTDVDVVLVRRMSAAGEHGIVRGPDLLRVVAGSMERIAEAAVAVYVQGPDKDLRRRSATPLESVESNFSATRLALELGAGLAPVFRHHMRQAITRQRVIQEGVTRRELARLAIGFVDMVGSTAMQAGLDPVELGDLVNRFETTAFEVISAGGGRLVKVIGDEIMVAAVDPVAGCRIVGDLVDAFTADGTQPRAGLVFGEVLFRHGDYYGPVVNLAARLTEAAIPGEALVDISVVGAVEDEGIGFEPAGRRMLKGFDVPVTVWALALDR